LDPLRKAGGNTAASVLSRIAAAVLGGYAFIWGFVTLGIEALVALHMSYSDAWTLVMMLAFLLFLGLFLWAFAARSLLRVWLVFAGGGALMTAAALLVGVRLAGAA
jgi:hypothetical protein